MFGLTPILECDNFAGNVTIPRNSLDEVIVIPSGTTCENCKATCHLTQCMELKRAENQALEKYTLLVLEAEDPFLLVDSLIDTDQNGSSQSYTQSEQLRHPAEPQWPSSADFPMESHLSNFSTQQNLNDCPQQTSQWSPTTPTSPAPPQPNIPESEMPAEAPIPLTPSSPPYPEPQATWQRNQDYVEILQEWQLADKILQIHCTQAHPEGYATQLILLRLAGRHGVVRSIQPEGTTRYLIQCIVTRVMQELVRFHHWAQRKLAPHSTEKRSP